MRVSLDTLKTLKDAGDVKAGLAWSDMRTYQNLFGSENVLSFWRSSGEYEVYYDVKVKNGIQTARTSADEIIIKLIRER